MYGFYKIVHISAAIILCFTIALTPGVQARTLEPLRPDPINPNFPDDPSQLKTLYLPVIQVAQGQLADNVVSIQFSEEEQVAALAYWIGIPCLQLYRGDAIQPGPAW